MKIMARTKPVSMPARNLKAPAHGGRADDVAIEDLQQSLRRHGQVQPIVARANGEVIIGERRRRASGPDDELEVVVLDVDEIEALEMRLSDEAAKIEMTRMEKALMLARLSDLLYRRDGKVTQETLADRVGLSQKTIADYLRLVSLPEPVQQMAMNREITGRDAQALASSKLEPKEKIGLARKFAEEKAPGGNKAAETVKFVEQAPEKIRRYITTPNNAWTLDKAKEAVAAERAKEEKAGLDDATAMRISSFWRRVGQKLREVALMLAANVELTDQVPLAEKAKLLDSATQLRDQCIKLIQALEGPAKGSTVIDVQSRLVEAEAMLARLELRENNLG